MCFYNNHKTCRDQLYQPAPIKPEREGVIILPVISTGLCKTKIEDGVVFTQCCIATTTRYVVVSCVRLLQ